MAETNETQESFSGEQAEQPVSADKGAGFQEQKTNEELNKDIRMWAMFCHLAGLGWFVVPLIGGVLGSLIVWQIKREEDSFIDEHGKEALNFQISMLIYGVIAILLSFVCIGFVLVPAVVIVNLVFVIIAAVKANNGQHYRYPLTIRFIK